MNLSDNEKRDIIKFLEAGKPLPEKYRFLLFDDDREVELVWNEKTNEVTNTVLPFQTIEHIDEPRSEDKKSSQATLFDTSGRQIKGWTNKLIWGDNKLILSSLKNGPMRKEIEAQGGLKLIYIDPPFDVGADFSMNIEIGDESFTKQPSVIEEVAYRDTWGKGADSFIAMIYERLKLMHDLLAENGSIYVHCDWRVNSYMKLILDEVFGADGYKNSIIWQKIRAVKAQSNSFGNVHDYLYFFSKSKNIFNQVTKEQESEYKKKFDRVEPKTERKYQLVSLVQKGGGPARKFGNKELSPPSGMHWIWSQERINRAMEDGLIEFTSTGNPRKKQYLDESGEKYVDDLWTDIFPVNSQAIEDSNYPTQKPESLLERIIKASSNEGDIIADFFCGSGTTLAVAEKFGRKWIGCDLGRFGIHTTRKRMIEVQRQLKKEGKNYRAFEILNLGRYEREYFVNHVSNDLREEEKRKIQVKKDNEYVQLILSAYKAEPVDSAPGFHGKKRDRLVIVGPVNLPVSASTVEHAISWCKKGGFSKVDILGFDYEMGIDFSEGKKHGVDLQFKVIPREVFDKKAVEKGQVKFYDVAYLEAKPIVKGRGNKKTISVELLDFSVFYNQENTGEVEEKLKPGGSKVVIENGQVIKISKDKKTDLIEREVLTKQWTDWVDYWSVDFDFENRKEIVKVIDPATGKEKEEWTGGYIFENEWQSFRTKKNKKLELVTSEKEVGSGKFKIAVKVVDIFGNDTTKVIEVRV